MGLPPSRQCQSRTASSIDPHVIRTTASIPGGSFDPILYRLSSVPALTTEFPMRARLSALALVVIASSIVRAQSPAQLALQRYSVDPMHSTVGFATTLLGGVKVRGRFNEYDATIVFDPAHPERSSVSAIIQAKSINTDMKFRDDHLRSPDFFDVDHYPTIQFVSERVVPRRGVAIVSGTLTMQGGDNSRRRVRG
jgi:polyisoprenoid-binding protein YceI